MNQIKAFEATLALAEKMGMARVSGSLVRSLTFEHIQDMFRRVEPSFSPAKLGRWLGWAQAALVAADVGVSLDDMKAINESFRDDEEPDLLDKLIEQLQDADVAHAPDDVMTYCQQAAEELQLLRTSLRATAQFAYHAVERAKQQEPVALGSRVADRVFAIMGAGGFSEKMLTTEEIARIKNEIATIVVEECS